MGRRSVSTWCAVAAIGVAAGAGLAAGSSEPSEQPPTDRPVYPPTKRDGVTDLYHGVLVADPYRWLEAMDSTEVRDWVAAQNAVTLPYLKSVPGRDAIEKRLTELWNFERYGTPFKEGGKYFYSYNPGLKNQNIIYVADSLDAEPRVLLDPNSFSNDGTVSLAGMSVSPDGKVVGYGKSDGGSDWNDWFFKNIQTGEDLTDRLTYTKFTGLSWAKDGSGVYYSRYPVGASGKGDDTKQVAIYFHKLGTSQSEDKLILDLEGWPKHRGLDPNPYAGVTDDGRYLIIHIAAGYHENLISYVDLADPGAGVRPVISEWKANFNFIGNDGPNFFFRTTDDAPNWRVVAVNVLAPERGNWREVIPQRDEPLQSVSHVGGRLVTAYLKDAKTVVKIHDTAGRHVRDVELPGIGSAGGFGGKADDSETFFWFTGFTTPAETYRYDVATGEATLFKRPQVAGLDPDAYETEQVFYTSKDGTRVPMFIIHRKGLKRDGSNPTLLYGYGGFNVSLTPSYSSSRMVWMEMGGVLAIPNIRGGGEYGKQWHLGGTKQSKQNVFDDFIAAAEWLIENKYTSTPKLAVQGGSNGGLLVGAVMTQRPELFGACLPAVGVLDMLRYDRASANARNWSTDYGLSENEDDFHAQYAYSPVHRVREGACYPPTLVTTGDHDDRVVPWHSYKFAAALQHAQSCDNPVLIRVETRAGHGAGKPTWMVIEEIADTWAFLVRTLKMEPRLAGAAPAPPAPAAPKGTSASQ